MKVNIPKYPSYPNTKRNVKIHIDPWDTWSLDSTLALIIHPALVQFKEQNCGYPSGVTETEWNTILDKMIFAFAQIISSWEDGDFYTGVSDYVFKPVDEDGELTFNESELFGWEMETGPNHTAKFDVKKYDEYEQKIQEGCELFGKYFRGLWL